MLLKNAISIRFNLMFDSFSVSVCRRTYLYALSASLVSKSGISSRSSWWYKADLYNCKDSTFVCSLRAEHTHLKMTARWQRASTCFHSWALRGKEKCNSNHHYYTRRVSVLNSLIQFNLKCLQIGKRHQEVNPCLWMCTVWEWSRYEDMTSGWQVCVGNERVRVISSMYLLLQSKERSVCWLKSAQFPLFFFLPFFVSVSGDELKKFTATGTHWEVALTAQRDMEGYVFSRFLGS